LLAGILLLKGKHMPEKTIQYYFKPSFFGAQVLWIKKQGKSRDTGCLGYEGPVSQYTIERKATPSEAAALLPILNAGLSDGS
jgi:hypothetical protein